MTGLFSTAYLGPISYYKDLLSCSKIRIEYHESWQKQSYRNRCYIDSPNGALMLNIPVEHPGGKQLINDVKISYQDNWPVKHWQAIQTSYNGAPFFEVLGPDLKDILDQKPVFLIDLNLKLQQMLFSWLRVDSKIAQTETWQANMNTGVDFRDSHHPKRDSGKALNPYPQVFDHKHGFTSNLSVIDLLFNEGPASYDYLMI